MSDLVMRMRTCAAAILGGLNSDRLIEDAADLLTEASNLLETPEPLGELMPVLPAVAAVSPGRANWGGTLNATAKPCPSCHSIDARTVRRSGRRLMLTCPVCQHEWEYGK